MKISILAIFLIASHLAFAQSNQKLAGNVDWSQPPLACIENIIPHASKRACPDLTRVEDMTKDIKDYSTAEEEAFWSAPENKKRFCLLSFA